MRLAKWLFFVNFSSFNNHYNNAWKLKEFSLKNEGKAWYLNLVQGRHDGLILIEA